MWIGASGLTLEAPSTLSGAAAGALLSWPLAPGRSCGNPALGIIALCDARGHERKKVRERHHHPTEHCTRFLRTPPG
jgi:hypothetical protein